ncbi:MAG TPA: hypothetical protein VFZ61_28325 [Polyangiales bacterium]
MEFTHTHTITIQHADGRVEKIAVDSGGRELRGLAAGTKVPLHTREEAVMELPADWVYTAEDGLTFFGNPEGPFKHASYAVAEAAEA